MLHTDVHLGLSHPTREVSDRPRFTDEDTEVPNVYVPRSPRQDGLSHQLQACAPKSYTVLPPWASVSPSLK